MAAAAGAQGHNNIVLNFDDLKDKLERDRNKVRLVSEDGNNLFRCVADYFEENEHKYMNYRVAVATFIESHFDEFSDLFHDENEAKEYCDELRHESKNPSKDPLYSSEIEFRAIKLRYRMNIKIYSTGNNIRLITFQDPNQTAKVVSSNVRTMELVQKQYFYHVVIPTITIDVTNPEDSAEKKKSSDGCCGFNTSALSWKFGFFMTFCALALVWGFIYMISPEGSPTRDTAYLWGVICVVVESAFGIFHFSGLLKLKETVDKIHKENLKYKRNNLQLTRELQELEMEVTKLTNIRIDLQNDKDTLSRAYYTYKGFNDKFQQLLDGKAKNLQFLKNSSNHILKRWRKSLIKHEKSIWNKLWDHFEAQDDKSDGMIRERFYELVETLPKSYQDRYREVRSVLPKSRYVTYDQFRGLVEKWVNESVSASEASSEAFAMSATPVL